jgi:AcrR family transcriptional regulator
MSSLRQRQLERTREDLIDAAYEVVRAEGVEKATLEQIALAAGTSRATLYVHFPGGREELLHAAFLRMGETHVAAAMSEIESRNVHGLVARIQVYARVGYDIIEDTRVGYFMNMYGPSLMRSTEGPYRAGHLERRPARDGGHGDDAGPHAGRVDLLPARISAWAHRLTAQPTGGGGHHVTRLFRGYENQTPCMFAGHSVRFTEVTALISAASSPSQEPP